MYAGNRMNNRESKKEESKKKEEKKEEEKKPKKPWLVPYRFGPNNCANPSGRPKKKPITDRYREALEVELPDDIRIPLGLKKGATMADAVARRMAIRAISGRQAVEAAREMREAIEGKTPTQPSEQPVAQTVNNTIILNSIIEKLLGDYPP
jgi:hypothetical protein